jgi:hypothetical protein
LQTGRPSSPTFARSSSRGGRWSWRPNRWRTRRSPARPRRGKGRGGQGKHVEVLTSNGEERQTTGGGGLGRPAAVPGDGGAPVDLQGRKADLQTCLGVAVLALVPDCSDSTPGRRIGRGNAGGASSTALGQRRSSGAEGRKAAARARGFGGGLK